MAIRENADEVNSHVIPWLREFGAEDDYFLHIQYWDAHGFYTYPEEYMRQFVDQPGQPFPDDDEIQKQRSLSHPRSPDFFHWSLDWPIPDKMPLHLHNRADVEQLVDGYDGGVFYMDRHVGEILNVFRELGIEDEVCFVITAGHGEIVDPMQEILRTGPFRYLGPREWEQRLAEAGWTDAAKRLRERYPEYFRPVRI